VAEQPSSTGPTLGRILGPGPSRDELLAALRTVVDPELGLNIVDLGLVYDARIDDGRAVVRLTTTTPACPIGAYLVDEIRWALLRLDGVVDVEIELTHDPPWSPERMSDEAKALLGWTR
jgi:metal-sulfur cluster biosynthetic enzyme